MKTPKEFDYDLLITDDGKCMVRIKSTGEVTEVERDVMRLLRAEEKRIRREMDSKQEYGSPLVLETLPEEDTGESWLIDTYDFQIEVLTNISINEFAKILTPKQAEIFKSCIVGGLGIREYARLHKISHVTALEMIEAIRKKYKIFFS